MTWVDIVIVILIGVALVQGFWRGFLAQVFQLLAIILSVIVSFWLFPGVGGWVERSFQLPISYARPLTLIVIFILVSVLLHALFAVLHKLIAPIVQANPLNRLLGAGTSAIRQVLIISITLAVLVTLPLPDRAKATIDHARLSAPLIRLALNLERVVGSWFKDDSLKSLSYRIVGTDESTTTALNYTETNPTEDVVSEAKLFAATNELRQKSGQAPLALNEKLREAARDHAKDMLAKGYFSHISPQGDDVSARVQATGLVATVVGENLATAPNAEIAQLGLVASESHRTIMLSSDFNAVGIGVMDAGSHGKMVVEVFAKTF